MAVANGAAMIQTSIKEFTRVGQQLRWLAWLAWWLLASYSLRVWTDDLLKQGDRTRR